MTKYKESEEGWVESVNFISGAHIRLILAFFHQLEATAAVKPLFCLDIEKVGKVAALAAECQHTHNKQDLAAIINKPLTIEGNLAGMSIHPKNLNNSI